MSDCWRMRPLPAMTMSPVTEDFPRFDVTGRVALVTGADVALGLRDADSGADLAAQIEGMGRRALRLPMDVTRLDQVRAGVDATVERFGRLDILVNNAGIAPGNPAELVREED